MMDEQQQVDMNADINERPDLEPVGIPYQDGAPTLTERLSHIEDVLHIT